MRRSSIAIIVAIIMVLTVVSGYIASESAQYNSSITVKNGVAYAETVNGYQSLDSIHENGTQIVALKITGYNGNTNNAPLTLPNTSEAHGEYTCNMSNHGVTFTVTNDTPCNER